MRCLPNIPAVFATLALMLTSTPPAAAQAQSEANRTLEWNADIDAPVATVWDAFTTEEGIKAWITPLAEVDLRIGGTIRTNYNPNGTIGDEGTIVHRILSLEPQRMLSTRVEKSPAEFPHAKAIEQVWGITYFEELSPNRTHIRLVSTGWGEGPDWDAAEAFFQAGNQWTLDKLKAQYAADATTPAAAQQAPGDDAEATLEVARRLVGGEWIVERQSPDGSTFRVRNLSIDGPDGASFLTRGWLGGDSGMFEHGQTQVWREPVTGEVRFQSINEHGHLARGAITSKGEDTIVWDWSATRSDGHAERYVVTMTFTGRDAYDMKIEHQNADGTYSTMVEMPFMRVVESPEAFHKMAAKAEE